MLELESITAAAGNFRLRDINISIAEGECHAVIGPSGAGKTTLLNAVLGIIPLERGRILLQGADVTRLPVEKRGMGYVPQQLGLFPHMTVRENLIYSARARRISISKFQPLVDKLVAAMNIEALLDRRPHTLSGGERQRVGLIRALASQPRLLLLDEPFAALNDSLRRELWRLLLDLQKEYRLTVLMITHDLAEALFLASHLHVLIEGRIRQQGSKTDVYHHPATLEVAQCLGINNLWAATVISSEPGGFFAECPSLDVTMRLDAADEALSPGTPVFIGIRAEDIKLRDDDHKPLPGETVIGGRARIHDLGSAQLVHFRGQNTGVAIEFEVSRNTAARFGLRSDFRPITLGFPGEAFFWSPVRQPDAVKARVF